MIGGLQGEFGDLDIKYIKQNSSKCRSQISGSFRRTSRHCILREKLSGWALSEDLDMSDWGSWNASSPIRRQAPDVNYSEKMEHRPNRIPAWMEWAMPAHRKGGPSACTRCRDPSPWWHGARIAIRSNSIRIPQEDTRRAPLSGLP